MDNLAPTPWQCSTLALQLGENVQHKSDVVTWEFFKENTAAHGKIAFITKEVNDFIIYKQHVMESFSTFNLRLIINIID
ncbi:hypothetical protein [Klebsiella michiganensis]|uniref:hypothetical protein n=1 Tax=Klebsiella michiganensis TaxID=1134687 RepID=UPI002930C81F|nr:hypothetical protein [Klebsiella michiganensis]HBM3271561.1 hypothetical protein [Klebsiella michiganensis]